MGVGIRSAHNCEGRFSVQLVQFTWEACRYTAGANHAPSCRLQVILDVEQLGRCLEPGEHLCLRQVCCQSLAGAFVDTVVCLESHCVDPLRSTQTSPWKLASTLDRSCFVSLFLVLAVSIHFKPRAFGNRRKETWFPIAFHWKDCTLTWWTAISTVVSVATPTLQGLQFLRSQSKATCFLFWVDAWHLVDGCSLFLFLFLFC